MPELTPERKWADSTTGKAGFMVITLTPIYRVVKISFKMSHDLHEKELVHVADAEEI